MISYFQFVNS